ncbi:hypothetical protein PAAL66ix_19919 [Paenibacillus alvei A6-6i-x]|nr:hypothetical protein PAAL66ix_19919 [Paenibacillus alvei A6-6i-x]
MKIIVDDGIRVINRIYFSKSRLFQVVLCKRAADFGKVAFLCESQKNAYRGQNYILCQGMFSPIVEEINMLNNQ